MSNNTIGCLLHLIAVLLTLIGQSIAIKCYQCHVMADYRLSINSSTPLCAKFDSSDEYVVNCPYSTMCRKKLYRYELQNNEWAETVTRGCAQQKNTDQVFRQGAWHSEHRVEEPYEEGCKELKENNLAGSSITYCHCRGNLCNTAASKESFGIHSDAMAVIFVFNVMKYFKIGATIQ